MFKVIKSAINVSSSKCIYLYKHESGRYYISSDVCSAGGHSGYDTLKEAKRVWKEELNIRNMEEY